MSAAASTLVLTLLVRDEADIVEANIDFHLSRGVDFVIATDNGSRDGTVDLLRRYERQGVLRLIHEPADNYAQARWVSRMARLAATEHGADWVVNADADEFWWPKRGTLKSSLAALPAEVGVVAAPRTNFLPRPGSHLPFWQRQTIRETDSFADPAVTGPGEKVCHRAHPLVEVEQGNHTVHAPGLELAADARPITIFHFPLRTYEQYENKIRLGGAAYARNAELDPLVGWTWRQQYEIACRGGLREEYERQVPSDEEIDAGIRDGRYIRERRLEHALCALHHASPGLVRAAGA